MTDEIRRAFGVQARVVPMTNQRVATEILTADHRRLDFQTYFVKEATRPDVSEILFVGMAEARPAPGVLEALRLADTIVVCPSNPIVSIGPILALRGVRDALRQHDRVIAVTPIVRGAALKGPADRMLAALGAEPSASGVAGLYADFVDTFVVDSSDPAEAEKIVGEVEPGDDLAALLVEAAGGDAFTDGDVVVVAHKVVSKSEGRLHDSTDRAAVALAEAVRVLRRRGDTLITETHHGLVCANSGVDASNVAGDRVVLLPTDPDLSARRLQARIDHLTGAAVAVIVSDTFGRTWREGQTNVAIGLAGLAPILDHRGRIDPHGHTLQATAIAVADELAAAAELVMGKTRVVPVALIQGAAELGLIGGDGAARDLRRRPEEDMFR
jgi:coenzyme F420-0:L-glutamate ligase/coenzyme F420-1:gamma-L-glutamate ligase